MEGKKHVKRVHHKSALPIYGAALVFLIWGLASPIYKLWAILLAAVTSAGAYFGLEKVFPGRDELVEEEIFTGDEELDGFLRQTRDTLKRFRALADQAGDQAVQEKINRIANATDAIVDDVLRDPNDKRDVYTFFSYYLPAMDKLLGYYSTFMSAGKGENVSEGKARIENSLGMVAEAFEKLLDRLFRSENMDIKTDISLMETMLRMDGLTDKTKKNEQAQVSAGKGGTNV